MCPVIAWIYGWSHHSIPISLQSILICFVDSYPSKNGIWQSERISEYSSGSPFYALAFIIFNAYSPSLQYVTLSSVDLRSKIPKKVAMISRLYSSSSTTKIFPF